MIVDQFGDGWHKFIISLVLEKGLMHLLEIDVTNKSKHEITVKGSRYFICYKSWESTVVVEHITHGISLSAKWQLHTINNILFWFYSMWRVLWIFLTPVNIQYK